MECTHYVIHYSEIAIKGKNRPWFESMLMDNIRLALKGVKYKKVKKQYGRILLELSQESNLEIIESKLKTIFGISSFSPCIKVKSELESIKEAGVKLVKEGSKSLNVKTKRSDKRFDMKSPDINREVGKYVAEKLGISYDYVDPDVHLFIEIIESGSYLYTKKIQGLGGLPVGVSGKSTVLISGGIDSPVASFLTLKRGCRNIYVHFHSEPYTKEASRKKVEELIEILSKYQQGNVKIYVVPFIDVQKEIMLKTDKKFRVILYRRFMFRIAEEIAKKEKSKALVTGENLAQVASQTLENLGVIEEVVNLPVIRPLITNDKQEIINLAKDIGTYETSILPHDDCCSLFVPKHPATKSDSRNVNFEEKKLDVDKMVLDTLKKVEKTNIGEQK